MTQQTSYIIAGFILVVFVIMMPLLIQTWISLKSRGRMMCIFVGGGKPVDFKLIKPDGDLLHYGEHDYIIVGKQIKHVWYPLVWPKILGMFQQSIDCSLYKVGAGQPLDWEDPTLKVIDSRELKAILDPHWLRALVRGVVEETQGGKKGGSERMMVFLSVGISAVCLILLFVVMTKISALQTAVKLIHP